MEDWHRRVRPLQRLECRRGGGNWRPRDKRPQDRGQLEIIFRNAAVQGLGDRAARGRQQLIPTICSLPAQRHRAPIEIAGTSLRPARGWITGPSDQPCLEPLRFTKVVDPDALEQPKVMYPFCGKPGVGLSTKGMIFRQGEQHHSSTRRLSGRCIQLGSVVRR